MECTCVKHKKRMRVYFNVKGQLKDHYAGMIDIYHGYSLNDIEKKAGQKVLENINILMKLPAEDICE